MPDIDKHLNLLAELTLPEGYNDMDTYRDFRETFLNSDHGRRTLKVILGWGNINKPTPFGMPMCIYRTMLGEGGRILCLKVMDTMLEEPKEKPEKVNVRAEQQEE